MLILEELATYLDAQGVGTYNSTTTGGDIYLNLMPVTPDAVIGLYIRGGVQTISTREDSCKFDNTRVQVITRGIAEDTYTPYDKAQSIYNLLENFSTHYLTVGGSYILNIKATQGAPAFIGKDDNQRVEYSLNFIITHTNTNKN